jgi:hypothetical protein
MRLSRLCVLKGDRAVAAEVVNFSWLLKVCPGILTGVFLLRIEKLRIADCGLFAGPGGRIEKSTTLNFEP